MRRGYAGDVTVAAGYDRATERISEAKFHEAISANVIVRRNDPAHKPIVLPLSIINLERNRNERVK